MSRIIRIPDQYTFNPFDIMILGTVNVGIYLIVVTAVVVRRTISSPGRFDGGRPAGIPITSFHGLYRIVVPDWFVIGQGLP